MTQAELDAEKAKENQYNQVSAQVMQIFIPAYAKLHTYFRQAAAAGQGAIPHKICYDSEGRQVTVYNSALGKVVGSYLTPTHEYITKALSQGKIGQAIGAIFGGQAADIQNQTKAICTTITPNQAIATLPPPPKVVMPTNTKMGAVEAIKQLPVPILIAGAFTLTALVIFSIRALTRPSIS